MVDSGALSCGCRRPGSAPGRRGPAAAGRSAPEGARPARAGRRWQGGATSKVAVAGGRPGPVTRTWYGPAGIAPAKNTWPWSIA